MSLTLGMNTKAVIARSWTVARVSETVKASSHFQVHLGIQRQTVAKIKQKKQFIASQILFTN
jgi:hypothetical protein